MFFFSQHTNTHQKTCYDVFWRFKEMPLSWDIHPSVAWMAFSFQKTLPRFGSGIPAVFLGALEVDFVGASNFPYFFYIQKRFQKTPGPLHFSILSRLIFFQHSSTWEGNENPTGWWKKGRFTIRRRRNFGEDQQTERQLARLPLWCLLLKGFWKAEKLLSLCNCFGVCGFASFRDTELCTVKNDMGNNMQPWCSLFEIQRDCKRQTESYFHKKNISHIRLHLTTKTTLSHAW